ncbi:MAG TPA: PAS domain-containing protein [Roseiarcus sp.]|nr:PAS domain-containing protein [Roseiarcus sp.]
MVVFIACEDITKRKRAEDAVRESATRFRALIEHAFDGVLLLDRDCGILYASPSVERVFGYPPRELVRRNALELSILSIPTNSKMPGTDLQRHCQPGQCLHQRSAHST